MYVICDTIALTRAIERFERALPEWWFSIGSCGVSRHASCGPDYSRAIDDRWLLDLEDRTFDQGFHCDGPDGTMATSLLRVMHEALRTRRRAVREGWK